MKIDEFNSLRLVGGTSLALQIGHRKSIDLDFFGEIDFTYLNIKEVFKSFDKIESFKNSKHINIFEINNVKVDFVNYTYPWLKQELEIDGIRLAQKEDIAAMKIAAITGRGSRKDFVDLFFLLKQFTFQQIMDLYKQKYFDSSPYLALKSLVYFDDAENDFSVEMIEDISWEEVKNTISTEVANYLIQY
jgi:predicted nucleotidyltransferase component of viral defense system